MKKFQLTGKVFSNKYLVGSCIGHGSFGEVYLVYNTEAEEIYAMKAEQDKTKNPQLINQARILKTMSSQRGFVPFHHYTYESKYSIVIMGLLGPSLEDLFNICNRSFSLKTILMLAQQIINRIQVFHSKNYVYRDIKPENFLMGLHQNSHVVHMIDFGLSKKYRDSKNHQHIPYKQGRPFAGTVRYSSINCHLGIQYSRRDDLQSIGYMLAYFFKGSLPWQGITANTNIEKYAKILEQKQMIPIQTQFMDMPIQFSTFMHYCRSMKFTDRPDYSFLKKLFTDLIEKCGYKKDYVYDWCKLNHTIKLESKTLQLTVRNKFSDLEAPYVTFMSNNKIAEEDIIVEIEEKKQKQNLVSSNNERADFIKQQQDFNEGNIDPSILEDSDMKLISHRNKWYDSYI